MKAVFFRAHGNMESLEYGDFPDPECGPNDVVIAVKAVSLNGMDQMILQNTTTLKTPFPMVPCGDVAGEIVALGADVSAGSWRPGQRVIANPVVPGEGMTGETRLGTCSQYVRFPVTSLCEIPDNVTFVKAACLPIAYGTARRMMLTRGETGAKDTVVILGASGGVGTACLFLAKRLGATVIACGSADWKLQKLREIGADHIINSRDENLVDRVHEICGRPVRGKGGGADIVVNYIGGDSWRQSLQILRHNGKMLTCGATAGYEPKTDIRYIWSFEHRIIGSDGWTMADLEALLTLVSTGDLQPLIAKTFGYHQYRDAFELLMSREFVGKIVLVPEHES